MEISRASLRRALIELLAHFPIYRTYATPGERPARDRPFIARAVAAAQTTALSIDRAVIDRLAAWLTETVGPAAAAIQDRALTQFQQLSAPVAAKAVEDTAFYRYGRLLSRNDVGFDVDAFPDTRGGFPRQHAARRDTFPHAMLATATHDHKRGEDVRARLAVLSEHADEWAKPGDALDRAMPPLRQAQDGALIPRASDIAMLLQMIVGAWPLDLAPATTAGRTAFAERLAQWQEKALREAKLVTDWALPNEAYEGRGAQTGDGAGGGKCDSGIAERDRGVRPAIAAAGAVNGLAQTLLKLTAPGVPDIYQGTELWDFSLVDPGQPPAGRLRAARGRTRRGLARGTGQDLARRQDQAGLGAPRPDAAPQQAGFVCRRQLRAASGSGEICRPHHCVPRRLGPDAAITVVPRIASALLVQREIGFRSGAWDDTALMLRSNKVKNIFDGQVFSRARVSVAQLFGRFPFALLMQCTDE